MGKGCAADAAGVRVDGGSATEEVGGVSCEDVDVDVDGDEEGGVDGVAEDGCGGKDGEGQDEGRGHARAMRVRALPGSWVMRMAGHYSHQSGKENESASESANASAVARMARGAAPCRGGCT